MLMEKNPHPNPTPGSDSTAQALATDTREERAPGAVTATDLNVVKGASESRETFVY